MIELIKKEIEEIYTELISVRRCVHENPEIGFEVDNTYQLIWNKLKEINISPIKCGKKGIVAYINSKNGQKEEKTILFRSDIDAVNIKEKTLLDFKSQNEYMHACGHDIHLSILLGFAMIAKRHEDKLNSNIKLMFQPAEESLEGAKDMIDEGVLLDCKEAYTIHVLPASKYKSSSVLISKGGIIAPSSDFFEIKLSGKATHGAMPEKGTDPIGCASQIIMAINNIITREKAISEEALITIGQIQGGSTYNVIPSTLKLKGTMRTYDNNLRSKIKIRLKEIVSNISNAFLCKGEIEFVSGCPPLKNDHRLSKKVQKLIKKNGLTIVNNIDEKSSGSEDFSNISEVIPSLYMVISAGSITEGYKYPLHNEKVIFNEEVIKIGVLIYSLIIFTD